MFKDRQYFSALLNTALPIAIQNFISSALNAVGVLMIGQLGESSVAGVGLANQIFFLLNLMLFGIVSGSAIFTAQYWGRGDLTNIRRVVVLCLGISLAAGAGFTVIALGLPRQAMGLYTSDPAVVEVGANYLGIIGFSYIATAVSFTYMVQLRATGNVRTPMLVSVTALGLGAALNYILIFGLFGLPVMGVAGAALGTCIARLGECAAMLVVTYAGRLPTAARLADLRGLNRVFVKHYLVTVTPVVANETVWSMGITIYNMVYARIGTEAIAAINITSTIEGMLFVIFIGMSNASAILIGNRIGAGEEELAFTYARRSLIISAALGVLGGAVLILISGPVVNYYKISALAAESARGILIVLGCVMWMRVSNMMLIVGILRSGGDTGFSLVLDVGTVWLVGIPMALLGAFVFKLPVYWVVAMVMLDELTKFAGGLYRFQSKKWMNNLVQAST
jgi:putative MATE family efflux protein